VKPFFKVSMLSLMCVFLFAGAARLAAAPALTFKFAAFNIPGAIEVSPKAVLPHFGQILDGVEAAHLQAVWHRDLKPENILFSSEQDLLVVADFGIAHFEEEVLLTAVETKNDERLANFLYSAPEQRSRGERADSKADIYALGLILNELFTGAVPQGTAFRKVSDAAPDYGYLDDLIEQMIRQDPSSRPTIADVKRDLIARGNEFVSLQKLNSLRTEVVPETEVDDPIVRIPIRLVASDYQNGNLVFTLSTLPPPNWIAAFQNPRGSWGSYMGAGPERFSFQGRDAYIGLSSGMQPQQMVTYMKQYIDLANRQYAEFVIKQHRERLASKTAELQRRIAEEERRQKVLAELKI
jgi:serine/threonine protein kinase